MLSFSSVIDLPFTHDLISYKKKFMQNNPHGVDSEMQEYMFFFFFCTSVDHSWPILKILKASFTREWCQTGCTKNKVNLQLEFIQIE